MEKKQDKKHDNKKTSATVKKQICMPKEVHGYIEENAKKMHVTQMSFMLTLIALGREVWDKRNLG